MILGSSKVYSKNDLLSFEFRIFIFLFFSICFKTPHPSGLLQWTVNKQTNKHTNKHISVKFNMDVSANVKNIFWPFQLNYTCQRSWLSNLRAQAFHFQFQVLRSQVNRPHMKTGYEGLELSPDEVSVTIHLILDSHLGA